MSERGVSISAQSINIANPDGGGRSRAFVAVGGSFALRFAREINAHWGMNILPRLLAVPTTLSHSGGTEFDLYTGFDRHHQLHLRDLDFVGKAVCLDAKPNIRKAIFTFEEWHVFRIDNKTEGLDYLMSQIKGPWEYDPRSEHYALKIAIRVRDPRDVIMAKLYLS